MQRLLMRLKGRHAGFTLIEVMIVIMVIGIIALFGVPKYSAVKEQYKLESAAQKVVAQLDFAKQMAMDKRETIYVVFQLDKVGVYKVNGTSLEIVSPPLFYEGGITFASSNNPWIPSVYSEVSSGTLLGYSIQFNNRGFVSNFGNIILQSSSGKAVTVTIIKKTGKIKIL